MPEFLFPIFHPLVGYWSLVRMRSGSLDITRECIGWVLSGCVVAFSVGLAYRRIMAKPLSMAYES